MLPNPKEGENVLKVLPGVDHTLVTPLTTPLVSIKMRYTDGSVTTLLRPITGLLNESFNYVRRCELQVVHALQKSDTPGPKNTTNDVAVSGTK